MRNNPSLVVHYSASNICIVFLSSCLLLLYEKPLKTATTIDNPIASNAKESSLGGGGSGILLLLLFWLFAELAEFDTRDDAIFVLLLLPVCVTEVEGERAAAAQFFLAKFFQKDRTDYNNAGWFGGIFK